MDTMQRTPSKKFPPFLGNPSMLPFLTRIQKGEILLADGATGTMLIAQGLKPGECPETWNLHKPEVLTHLTKLYVEAGSDFVTANTFGASPLKLAAYSLQDKMEEINRAGIEAVRKGVVDRAYVAASCGPSGKILKPYGDTELEVVFQSFVKQMKAIVASGADLICIETMMDLEEAKLAIRAAKEVSSQIPVIATMTFDSTPRGFYTLMGNSVEKVAQGLEKAGADVLGSNCGNGIENMVEIARQFRKATRLPLIFQANAGLPQRESNEIFYRETPAFMAEKAKAFLDLPISVLGGCCGTTPEHIRAWKKMIRK